MHDIYITGIGMVSPLGTNHDSILENLEHGSPSAGWEKVEDEEGFFFKVKDFDPKKFVHPKKLRRMDLANIYSIASAKMAMEDAGLDPKANSSCGVIVGTGFSGFSSVIKHQKRLLKDGIENLSPVNFPTTVANASSGLIAIELGLNGCNTTVTGLGTSGENALLFASLLLNKGALDKCLVIGTDELCSSLIQGYRDLRLSYKDEQNWLPYHKHKNGVTMGEGSAALLLESRDSLYSRGGKSYGKLMGIGSYQNCRNTNSFARDPEIIKESIREALSKSNLNPEDIHWVSSGANGNPSYDNVEANALCEFFNPEITKIRALTAYTGDFPSSGIMRMALGFLSASRYKVPNLTMPTELKVKGLEPFMLSPSTAKKEFAWLHQSQAPGESNVSLVFSTN